MATSKAAGGRRLCGRGKSCGRTCISRTYLCVMNIHPDLVSQLRYARDLVRRKHGKKHTYFGSNKRLSPDSAGAGGFFRMTDREINKLNREFKKLPDKKGKRANEIKERILELERQRGAARGYDNSYYD